MKTICPCLCMSKSICMHLFYSFVLEGVNVYEYHHISCCKLVTTDMLKSKWIERNCMQHYRCWKRITHKIIKHLIGVNYTYTIGRFTIFTFFEIVKRNILRFVLTFETILKINFEVRPVCSSQLKQDVPMIRKAMYLRDVPVLKPLHK